MKMSIGQYPTKQLRRLRQTKLQRLFDDVFLQPQHLIWPVFVVEGTSQKQPITTMPGVFRYSIDQLLVETKNAYESGIRIIAIFPYLSESVKSDTAIEAISPNSLVCRAIKALKESIPDMLVMVDIALDPYTTHGHDGILYGDCIDNEATVKLLQLQACLYAEAGCDIIAPSDMMDGRILRIRSMLDQHYHTHVPIFSYATKFVSHFYAPFREAVGTKSLKNKELKATYQMSPLRQNECIQEATLDEIEGADALIIKPGLLYLDIVAKLKQHTPTPLISYHVSGEYAQLKIAGAQGALDYDSTLIESLYAFRRAGSSLIITYGAIDAARILNKR